MDPRARLGLLLPGLGHLLHGEVVFGCGLLCEVALLARAAPAIPRALAGTAGTSAEVVHPVLAVLSWVAIAVAVWTLAWRRARPATALARPVGPGAALRALARHRSGLLGGCGVALVVTVALLAPLLAPFDPLLIDAGPARAWPGGAFLLGTDGFGRDLLSRLLYGARVSLSIGALSASVAATVGTTVGAVAGWAGGMVDRALMWIVDLLIALPHLVLVVTVAGLLQVHGGASVAVLVVVLGLTGWMGVARVVRAQVLSLREQEFVLAARAMGMSPARVLARHVLPNTLAPVIVYCSLAIGAVMLAEASLSFLGLGVPPPTATWGQMVSEGRDAMRATPWVALFPGLAIVLSVTSFNLLGDGLRDALDPRLRR